MSLPTTAVIINTDILKHFLVLSHFGFLIIPHNKFSEIQCGKIRFRVNEFCSCKIDTNN